MEEEARVRDEYVWPYANVTPGVWYPASHKSADEPGWFWVHTKPTATFALREHFEVRAVKARAAAPDADLPCSAAADVLDDAHNSGREARLRTSALRRYGGVLPGIWVRAQDLIAILRPVATVRPGERRRQRLPSSDFDFRTRAAPSAPSADSGTDAPHAGATGEP